MRKLALFFAVCVCLSIFISSTYLYSDQRELLKKVETLREQKEYSKALDLLDKGLKEYGEAEKLLAAKTDTLVEMNRLEDALPIAMKRAEVAKRKSPWHAMAVMTIYLKLEKIDEAFKWLNMAVDRGFLSYRELDHQEYNLLRKDKRLNGVIEKIKSHIGIGKPPLDFTVDLLNGEKFTLSKQKGKVILIDFWATWCPPCVKGIPHLKKFYEEYKDKGFEVIGISLDNKKELVTDYIAKEQIEWKMVYSGSAWFDDIAKKYKVNLIPSYWLIDRNGILRDFGMHLRNKATMKKAIDKLVAE